MPETTVIHIQWEGPCALAEVYALSAQKTDYGLYQVCGSHPVYGRDALLYIGKAGDQTFAERAKQENWENWEAVEGKVAFYIGRLYGSETPPDSEWNRQINAAEALLINAHNPALNKHLVEYLPERQLQRVRDVHVVNLGDRGVLLPEVSGARWSDKYDDMPNYGPYGSHQT